MQAAGIPGAQTLTGRPGQTDDQRGTLQPAVPEAPGDLAGQPGTDRAIGVVHPIMEQPPATAVEHRQGIGDHALGQLAAVERPIVRLDAEPRLVRRAVARLGVNRVAPAWP